MKADEPSLTAEVIAMARAAELERPPETRILEDRWAHQFIGARWARILEAWKRTGRFAGLPARFGFGMIPYTLSRHRFTDEVLLACCREIEQVVLLGAGYDTKAYRFSEALDHRPVFELDFPATVRRKLSLLEPVKDRLPPTDVRHIEIDFENESIGERLLGAGFQKGAKTFFVWEGVTMYLPLEAVRQTLRGVRSLAGEGSRLVADFKDGTRPPGVVGWIHRWGWEALGLLGEPIRSDLPSRERDSFFTSLGFSLEEGLDREDLRRRYIIDGRPICHGFAVLSCVAV